MADEEDKTQVYLPGGKEKQSTPSALGGGGPPAARLVCQDVSFLEDGSASLEIALAGSTELTLGRDEGNHVTIRSKQLSRRHAQLYPGDGKWGIKDLDSRNGTWVNDSNVKETWLNPGDLVKIGPIPFKYELERPDLGDSPGEHPFSETIVDKTMLVGSDVRAASALLRAAEKAHEEPPREAAPARARNKESRAPSERRPARSAAAAPAPAKKKGGAAKIAIIAVVVLAVLGGGGYFGWDYFAQADKRESIKIHGRDIKRFFNEHEQAIGDYDADANKEELGQLKEMFGRVNDSVQKYPASPELREQQAQLLFLTFERQLGALLEAEAPDKALRLQESTEEALTRVASAAGTGHPPLAETLGEIEGLLRLSEAVIRVRAFRLEYPSPTTDAASKPAREEVDEALEWRRQFANEKKNNNLALSVRYRYFGRIVKEVDGKDLRVLDRWNQLI